MDEQPRQNDEAVSENAIVDDTNNQKQLKRQKQQPQRKQQQDDPLELVPQLKDYNITYGDLQIAVNVLNAVATLNNDKKSKNSKKRKNESSDVDTMKDGDDNDSTNLNSSESNDNNDKDGLELYKLSNLRTLRKAIASCMELHRKSMYDGMKEEEYYQQKMQQRTLKRQKHMETAMQQKFIQQTILRKGRIDKLNQLLLNSDNDDELHNDTNAITAITTTNTTTNDSKRSKQFLVPDGHVETNPTMFLQNNGGNNNKNDHDSNDNSNDSMLLEQKRISAAEEGDDRDVNDGVKTDYDNDDNGNDIGTITTATTIRLPKLRSCYVCKVRYRDLHPFYDQLCPECATINWTKRHQTADLQGKIAIVTGSRVKIGYQTCLKLLRAGCTVIATTRFPNSACETYRKEPDFHTFQQRLHIYGLDLRDITGIEAFTRYLKMKYSSVGIDILINNACQTVRRPNGYYIPIIQKEQAIWENSDTVHKQLLHGCYQFEQIRRQILLEHTHPNSNNSNNHNSVIEGGDFMTPHYLLNGDTIMKESDEEDTKIGTSDISAVEESTALVSAPASVNNVTTTTHFELSGITHSAAMSQMILLPEDVGVNDTILPPGVTDVNGQQIDLRTTNSWLLKMEEISTPELMECMFINAIAPFVLNSRLKPLMTIPTNNNDRPDRYIINVSAMEGKFYRFKTECHPHTNMAKAALNMLTRTSAYDLATKYRIYMNSVDTGWINDENPLNKASRIAEYNKFQTPIDEIDAAARIVDPIFSCVKDTNNEESKLLFGKFLKDYKESEW